MTHDQDVTTAVVAAAGSASRMWPASKVVPKELFPLGRVPAIVHLFGEFAAAGIRSIVLVVADQCIRLIDGLLDRSILPPERVAGDAVVRDFDALLARVRFTVIRQSGPYGNAMPLILASDLVGTRPCVYAFGDDIVLGENITEGLLETYKETGRPVLAAQEVDERVKSAYGIVEGREEGNVYRVTRLIEKPDPGMTDSRLAAFGRYLVTPDLMDEMRRSAPGRDNEVWFVDAVVRQLEAGQAVYARPLTRGTWYTVGNPESYAKAVVAAADAELGAGRTRSR